MNKQIIMSGVFLICVINVAHADVYVALQHVYDKNPVINQGRTGVDLAVANVKTAMTNWQPYVGVSGNIGAARTKVDEYTFDYSPLQYGVEFQQNIFQGGANLARIKSSKSELNAAKANLSATQQEVFLDAINAYINVLNTREVLNLNKNNQVVLTEYYNQVRDRQSLGALTQTDVSQAAARLEMAKYSVADAGAAFDNALETFKRICNECDMDFVDINLSPVSGLFPYDIDVAEEYALRHHPLLIALGEYEDAARQNINVAYQSILPDIDVRGAIQQMDDVPYLDEIRDSRIGVYVRVPLYDKGTAFANADKVRANIADIQDKIIDARRVVIENLRSAWNIYNAQEYAISAAAASVDANRLALDGMRDEQARGRRTVLDVLNAEQDLLDSRVAHTRAIHSRISAYFAILAATGKLTPENLGLVAE